MGSGFLDAQHFWDHLKVFGHRMSGHLASPGNGTVIGLIRVKPHVLPDLPLLFGEFLLRRNSSQ